MRSTLIIATFALSTLAVPVPEADPILKSGVIGCAKIVGGLCVAMGKREARPPIKADIEARFAEPHLHDERGSRALERAQNPHSDVDEPETPALRIDGRSPAIRNQGRSPAIRNQGRSPAIRNQGRSPAIRNQGRSPAIRNQGRSPAIRNQGRSPTIQDERRSPAFSRPKSTRKVEQEEEEAEFMNTDGFTRPPGKREALPLSRGSHSYRSVESGHQVGESAVEKDAIGLVPRYIRGKPPRSAEAEVFEGVSHSQPAEPQPEPDVLI
ncbi:hypothetical protein SLS60_008959 [Paraconiothyrium brasiliense]|uniref:Uncharacterized protein n=1 Tax=Paraconiothyrium brasiliense TaxID=300254 RepID=A0ABR3QVW9_9PLEO